MLSHGHGDHMADLETIQKNSGAQVICIADIAGWLGNKGITNVHAMNFGGGFNFDFGRVKMVYALHSSSMPDGAYGGNPAGYVIYSGRVKRSILPAIPRLLLDMQLLALENLDLAILPIGDNYTMGADDAIKACGFINCKKVIGMHYDTFPVIVIDKAEAKHKFEKAGIDLTLLEIGSSMDL